MRHINITSPENQVIKEVLKIKKKHARCKQEAFLIDGRHLLEMAMTSADVKIKKVFFTEKFFNKRENHTILKKIESRVSGQESGDFFVKVSENILSRLVDTETPQGIASVVSYKAIGLNEIKFKGNPFLVICDEIQDPGNLGTIIRASDAAGADAVISLPGTCDVFMQKAIRATAGSLFHIPIAYTETAALLDYLNFKNIILYATDVHAQMSIYEYDLKKPVAIVFGNEAHGVSEAVLKRAKGLKIPIIGKAESLNVAMAASICLYEVVRQRLV